VLALTCAGGQEIAYPERKKTSRGTWILIYHHHHYHRRGHLFIYTCQQLRFFVPRLFMMVVAKMDFALSLIASVLILRIALVEMDLIMSGQYSQCGEHASV